MYSKYESFIDMLFTRKVIKTQLVRKVMKKVHRGDFCSSACEDSPQPIGYNATISAPHMHAMALELLAPNLKNCKNSLDVGSGTGYLTASFYYLMEHKQAKSYGIQHIEQLVALSIKNITKNHKHLIDNGNIVIKVGDGRKGWMDKSIKFGAIHVGAASENIPKELVDSLQDGGRLVIPVGMPGHQEFLVIDKKGDKLDQKCVAHVTYVPLTDKQKQLPKKWF